MTASDHAYVCAGQGSSTQMPDLPWACSNAQHDQLLKRIAALREDPTSCLPSGLVAVAFLKGFGGPGALKTSEYLLLGGPIGKYLLQGAFHAEQEKAIFR